MNVSMMDSYNLAWKLAHKIHGLSPEPQKDSVLRTYESERVTVARMLIEFDTKFSSMFSGQIGSDSSVEGLTHEQFLKVFSDGSGFTSGCGIEYPQSILVKTTTPENSHLIYGDNYLQGTLKPGRRLLDSVVRRYADSNLRHLQDGMFSLFVLLFILQRGNHKPRLPFYWTLSDTPLHSAGLVRATRRFVTSTDRDLQRHHPKISTTHCGIGRNTSIRRAGF